MAGLAQAGAWAVHAYTASGALLAWLALVATLSGDYRTAFLWLAAQMFVDATDGWLARLAKVHERTPLFDGAQLDNIVDYLTYVLVPAVMVWHAPLVPETWRLAVAGAMLLSSAYGFSRADAKTPDHYFTGFPSYWNVVVFYLMLWDLPAGPAALLLVGLAVLVFLPLRYVYPSRTVVLMPLTVTLGFTWGVLMLLALWWWTRTPAWLKWAGLAFPAYYVGLSLWLEGRRLRR
jgi:phosphatidylcholine synthase